jgi:hypothetical protein
MGASVWYQIVRGADGRPGVVRVETKTAQEPEPLSHLLPPTGVVSSEEEKHDTPDGNTPIAGCPFRKSAAG